MTTLTTDHFRYIADNKLFCCSIDTLSTKVMDDILIGDSLTIVNPKTRNRRKFTYLFQMKDRWVYRCGSITLYIYKGDKYKGIPSPGIDIPEPKKATNVVGEITVLENVPKVVLDLICQSKQLFEI